jgi:hypothetical protein
MDYGERRIPYDQRPFGTSSTKGGYSQLLDYCPVYRSYSNGDCTCVATDPSVGLSCHIWKISMRVPCVAQAQVRLL